MSLLLSIDENYEDVGLPAIEKIRKVNRFCERGRTRITKASRDCLLRHRLGFFVTDNEIVIMVDEVRKQGIRIREKGIPISLSPISSSTREDAISD
jgi:hypothetical protein